MSNPTKTRPCVARMHLRGADFSVYDAACALTAHSDGPRILSASRETLAQMTGYAPRSVGFARERLVERGFLIPVASGDWQEDQRRKSGKSGSFAVPKFRVVGHDEWALAHPGQCPTVVRSTVHGESVDGKTEDAASAGGSSAHGRSTDTVVGPTADTVVGKPRHKALSLSRKKKPVASADAPQDGRDFESLKITERVKKFLALWSKAYQAKYSNEPTINWPTEIKRLRPIFERNQDTTIKTAARSYLDDRTDFTIGHPLGKFVSQFDRWRALGTPRNDDDGETSYSDFRPPDFEERQELCQKREGKAAQ